MNDKVKKVLKLFGILAIVVLVLPAIKLLAACLAGLVVGLVSLVITAPLVTIPMLLLLALFVWIDYLFVKWLINKFC